MSPKKTIKPTWKCEECGKPTDQPGKICMVCATEHTKIKGYVKAGEKPKKHAKKAANAIKGAGMCDALDRALDLETEGREFYLRCAEKTRSRQGKEMFGFLANEEKIHYEKISKLYEREEYKGYCSYVEAKGLTTGVFERKVKGGDLSEKSDALDALNVGIRAEDNSIELYSTLAADAGSGEMRAFFEHLVSEERRHRSILENEVEFVTGTGEFVDFKTVTM